MVEQIMQGLYIIELPLPDNPLKSINSYVIPGRDRNLIVDTGMNRFDCGSVENTDYFITHQHADHSGLVSSLATGSSTIFCSHVDST